MKNLLKLSSLLFLSLILFSCSDDDDNGTNPDNNVTIAEFVANNENYSSLEAALDAAGLTATLNGDTDYTVFAPDNAAFSKFLADNNFATLADVPVPLLKNVLLNHVLQGDLESSDFSTGYVNTLAVYGTSTNNLSLYVNVGSSIQLNGASTVSSANIEAKNGTIHAVSSVIPLPTVVTFATIDPTFSTLTAALTRADQPDFVATLSATASPAPFTVLAPTNAAFEALLIELDVDNLSDIDGATLTAALNTHVIAGANVRAADLTDGPVTTLGSEIVIDASAPSATDPNDRISNIIVTNVQAINGVVHAIDKVLLPQL